MPAYDDRPAHVESVPHVRRRMLADGIRHARMVASAEGHDLHPFVIRTGYAAGTACRKCGRLISVRTIEAVAGTSEARDGGWTFEIAGHAIEDECDVIPFRPRSSSAPLLSAVAVTLAAVVAFLAPARATAASSIPIVTHVAAAIAGHDVSIACDTPTEWAAVTEEYGTAYGWTFWLPGPAPAYALLSPTTCRGLRLAAADTTRARASLLRRHNPGVNVVETIAVGIDTLVHEAEHLAGIYDESAAWCAAANELPYAVGELVGYRHDRALVLVKVRAYHEAVGIALHWAC